MYVFILRKLNINKNTYFQIIDKCLASKVENGKIQITDSGSLQIQELENALNTGDNLTYLEVNQDVYQNYDIREKEVLKEDDNKIVEIEDIVERNNVILDFYKIYHDFTLVPDFNIEELLNQTKTNLKEKIIGQDEVINRIIGKLYTNFMFYKTELETSEMRKNKSNILMLGPFGTGKTKILENLKNSLERIPVVTFKFTGDFSTDLTLLINKLLNAANFNIYLAERGIVIFDELNYGNVSFLADATKVNIYLDEIKKIVFGDKVYLPRHDNEDSIFTFDISLLTCICAIDMNYDDKIEESYDGIPFYSIVESQKFQDLGFDDKLLFDGFDNEIIYMNPMTKETALKILKNKKLSPLYQIVNTLEQEGKKVRISKNFIATLIKNGLETNEGFSGIIRILKYVLNNKDYNSSTVSFKENDFDNLSIGTVNLENDLDDEFDENSYDEDKEYYEKAFGIEKDEISDVLKVDSKKRTINGLKVMDVVRELSKKIIGQDEPIFEVVNAFYNHIFSLYNEKISSDEARELKKNVLLIGETGVGKTSILRSLADFFDLPFVKETICDYSPTGYVGPDLNEIIKHLIAKANGDIKKAQLGIICFDEIDKLVRDTYTNGENLTKGIQNELLTFMEGETKHIQTNKYQGAEIEFDTSKNFTMSAGVFEGIDKIVRDRIKKEIGLGFQTKVSQVETQITPKDLGEYGINMQNVGRYNPIIILNKLKEDDFYKIIANPNGGYVTLVKYNYEMKGITLTISDTFMRNLAQKAIKLQDGVRGIRQIFDKIVVQIDRQVELLDNVVEVSIGDNALEDSNDIKYISKVKKKIRKK